MTNFIKIFFVSITVFSFLFSANLVLASDSVVGSLPEECQKTGDCEVNDFARIFTFYYSRVLGIVGSIALLMFVYGGVMLLISAGNSDRVTQAKGIITAAIVGLIIVFTSYMIIQFVFDALGIKGATGGGWAEINWFGGN